MTRSGEADDAPDFSEPLCADDASCDVALAGGPAEGFDEVSDAAPDAVEGNDVRVWSVRSSHVPADEGAPDIGAPVWIEVDAEAFLENDDDRPHPDDGAQDGDRDRPRRSSGD